MIIYGEYLFLENFITGMIILFFTGKILGQKLTRLRILFCGICCGAYAFILFTTISGIRALIGKVLFSLTMVMIAFGKKSPKRTLQNAMVFLAVTVLYGGIAIALLTSFGWTGVTAAAGVYLPPMSYLTVTAVAAFSAWLLQLLIELIKTKRMEQRTHVEAKVSMGTSTWTFRGLIDSGNMLKEPLTGKPVCIVRRSLMEEMLSEMETPERRYTLVPYRAVGTESGMLEGYRFDTVTSNGKTLNSPVLAICEEKNFFAEGSETEILLPGCILERGIYGDY